MAEDDEGQEHGHGPAWPVDARLVDGMARAVRAEYVPAARAELHAWLASGPGPRTLRPGRGRAGIDRTRAARELAAAELVHLGEDLAATVAEAASNLPGWYRPRAEDVPTTAGFAVYAHPPLIGEVPVRAVLWSPRRGRLAVTLWADGEHALEETGHDGQGADELAHAPTRLLDVATLPLPPQGRANTAGPAAEAGETVRLAVATWLVLGQDRAVEVAEARGSRSVRRAIAVGGVLPPEAPVHAIELTHTAGHEHQPAETAAGPRGWWRPQRTPNGPVGTRRPWWATNHQR